MLTIVTTVKNYSKTVNIKKWNKIQKKGVIIL